MAGTWSSGKVRASPKRVALKCPSVSQDFEKAALSEADRLATVIDSHRCAMACGKCSFDEQIHAFDNDAIASLYKCFTALSRNVTVSS